MGILSIQLSGSFEGRVEFQTCAAEGGHVQAIKRGIEFLTSQLGHAVVQDAQLTKDGIDPPTSQLGTDANPCHAA